MRGTEPPSLLRASEAQFPRLSDAKSYARKWAHESGDVHTVWQESPEGGFRERVATFTRKNPAVDAAALAEAFHGTPPGEATEIDESVHEHEYLAGLGELDEITLDRGKLDGFQGALLASNEAGTQLFIVGGDQQVPAKSWPDLDWSKERVLLGEIRAVVYTTAKAHLGKADRRRGPYSHKLKPGGFLEYDTVNRKLAFVGGRYHIGLDMDDGRHSAGIVD